MTADASPAALRRRLVRFPSLRGHVSGFGDPLTGFLLWLGLFGRLRVDVESFNGHRRVKVCRFELPLLRDVLLCILYLVIVFYCATSAIAGPARRTAQRIAIGSDIGSRSSLAFISDRLP